MVFIWEHCGQLWAALLLPAWLKAAADFSLIPHSFRLWVHLLMCELLHAYKSLNNCWGLGGNPPPKRGIQAPTDSSCPIASVH